MLIWLLVFLVCSVLRAAASPIIPHAPDFRPRVGGLATGYPPHLHPPWPVPSRDFSSSVLSASAPQASSSPTNVTKSVPSASVNGPRSFSTLVPRTPLAGRGASRFAFAFDIDGVLLHVAEPIPGAKESLRFLHDNNIPFIFLTNGGGKREIDRVADLSKKLEVPLTTENFVQSHTPFKQLVDGPNSLRDKTIMVTGSDYERCRVIAEEYGFKKVVTPADIIAAEPSIFPFHRLEELQNGTKALPKPLYGGPGGNVTQCSSLKIDAMFVLDDPRDWSVDIQIMMDLLLSCQGYLGTHSPRNGDCNITNCGWQEDGQPQLYFSNGDLVWAAKYHLPRFGQGAFQAALAGVWHRYTGGHELRRKVIGKPVTDTYQYAERVLAEHRHETLRKLGYHDAGALTSVYMVGDNPESDIAGANGHVSENGTDWWSILVQTGVWNEQRDGYGALTGVKEPTVIVENVKKGVQWALEREGWQGRF